MTAHRHLTVIARTDRKARGAVVMRRAAGHPCCPRTAPAECPGNGFSGHGAPSHCSTWQAGAASSLAATSLWARPFGEHAEEAGDIVNDLAGVIVGEIAPDARLPDLAAGGRCARPRHCRLQRRDVSSKTSRAVPPARASGLRSRTPTDDAGPNVDLHLQASPSQGSPVVLMSWARFSAAPRSQGS